MNDTPAIYLENVNRYYGSRRGVIGVSASIPEGKLVGLLGPNGSGKTTTIRILSCFLPPSSGVARVCGFDVFNDSLEVRRRVGYLPENCPLYPEMRVIEYLHWIGELKGVSGSELDRAIYNAAAPCGIDGVYDRPIGVLSKGFRQRVALASILLFKPKVLILDEPTIGLDPMQVRQFRALLESLKRDHTILLSSHILTEVEMLCDSVMILNDGYLIADGKPDDLRAKVGQIYRLTCKRNETLPATLPKMIERIPGLHLETLNEDSEFAYIHLRSEKGDPREALYNTCVQAGFVIVEMAREKTTLEDVFVQYVQNAGTNGNPNDKAN